MDSVLEFIFILCIWKTKKDEGGERERERYIPNTAAIVSFELG